jgi:proline iminopeptidase
MERKACLAALGAFAMCANLHSDRFVPRDGYIPVENAELYFREIGTGRTLIILHGGPDFDHSYLLPEMDHLADSYRLIYYDQRGRGKSARDVRPEDVTIQSEVEDLESLRRYFQLESLILLGHSWGGLLALEYAIQNPDRVSHLILMNPAPVSQDDYALLKKDRREQTPADIEELRARSENPKYQQGAPDTVADYYRVHFRATIRPPDLLERVIQRLQSSFTKEGILKARAIEKRLMEETWFRSDYDLLPKLTKLNIPTLVISGDYDFIPAECASHIAEAIPKARLVVLKDCGHFSYLERPDQVHKKIDDFFETKTCQVSSLQP